MKVTFLTRRTDHELNNNDRIYVAPEERWPTILEEWIALSMRINPFEEDNLLFKNWLVMGYDIENRFDFPVKEGLLLSSFCIDGTNVLTIDNTSVDNKEIFSQEILNKCLMIAHNADHEARWDQATGFSPMRYGCTMVNSKRLLSGQTGYKFDLISEINRRLGVEAIPIWTEKDIRSEFKDCKFFRDDHILYNAADTIRLKQIFFKQLEEAEKLGQSFLHRTINSRVIKAVAEAEMRGIRHDSEKWIGIAKDREARANTICQELEQLIKDHYGVKAEMINAGYQKEMEALTKRKAKLLERQVKSQETLERLTAAGKQHLKVYKTTQKQLVKIVTDLASVNSADTGGAQINWGSPIQIKKVFQLIGCPLPEAKDKKTHQMKPGVGKEARANWFVANPEGPFVPFMTQFDKYKKLIHNVNSFGENWVAQYVRLDGKIYTLLDQAGADTGRFTSGDKGKKANKKHPNMQQIPKPQEYRDCFIADPGRKIITADYKNCEGVVMIAQSGDLNMKKITELPDQHSYLGTKCWRNVYAYRYSQTGDVKWGFLAENYEMNKSTPEKDKERSDFKNSGGLFPVAYGVAANKVAASAKISEREGQIMINTIKAEIPLVIEYLDTKSKEASKTGYVVHNTRTGSRRGFTKILDNIHYGFPIGKGDIIEAEMAARNSPIQGTNSDLMKEAIIWLTLWAYIFKQDVRFLLTVHDELVCDCPEDKGEFFAKKIEQIMIRAAQNYLIPEITMGVDVRVGKTWQK